MTDTERIDAIEKYLIERDDRLTFYEVGVDLPVFNTDEGRTGYMNLRELIDAEFGG